MATLGATMVTAGVMDQPIPGGEFHLEVWRVAGGAIGDTATITPKRGRFVGAAIASQSCQTSLSTLGTDTAVTLTLTASVAATATFDALLFCIP